MAAMHPAQPWHCAVQYANGIARGHPHPQNARVGPAQCCPANFLRNEGPISIARGAGREMEMRIHLTFLYFLVH